MSFEMESRLMQLARSIAALEEEMRPLLLFGNLRRIKKSRLRAMKREMALLMKVKP